MKIEVTNVALHESKVTFDDQWITVPEWQFRTLEPLLGMSLTRKVPGHFADEIENVPEPAELSYIATPESIQNQYGARMRTPGEDDIHWHWFENYLLLSSVLNSQETLTPHDYGSYRAARARQTTWFGQDPVTGRPRFGTNGTSLNSVASKPSALRPEGELPSPGLAARFQNSPYTSRNQTSFAHSKYATGSRFQQSEYVKNGLSALSRSPNASPATMVRSPGTAFEPLRSENRTSASFASPGLGQRFGATASGAGSSPAAGRSFGRNASSSTPSSSGRSFGRR